MAVRAAHARCMSSGSGCLVLAWSLRACELLSIVWVRLCQRLVHTLARKVQRNQLVSL